MRNTMINQLYNKVESKFSCPCSCCYEARRKKEYYRAMIVCSAPGCNNVESGYISPTDKSDLNLEWRLEKEITQLRKPVLVDGVKTKTIEKWVNRPYCQLCAAERGIIKKWWE